MLARPGKYRRNGRVNRLPRVTAVTELASLRSSRRHGSHDRSRISQYPLIFGPLLTRLVTRRDVLPREQTG